MRNLGRVFLFVVLGIIAVSSVSAQHGAIVLRGEGGNFIGYNWDGDNTLSVYTTNSEFYCGPGYDVTYQIMVVLRPNDVRMYHDRGHYFTRIWYATPDDLFAGDPFEFICSGWVAEGISHATFFDNDENVTGPGSNVWGNHFAGTLYDSLGQCADGMVDFNQIRRWKILANSDYPACWPDCLVTQVIRGPSIECAE